MHLFVKQKNKAETENKQVGEVYFASAAKNKKKQKKTNSTGKHNANAANRMGGGDIKIHRVK